MALTAPRPLRTAPQSDADAKANAKTEAKPEAAPKADAKANAAAPQGNGPAITKIEKPEGVLKVGAYYASGTAKPVFKVTLSGLTVGKGYGILTNLNDASATKPAVGDAGAVFVIYGDGFAATTATQTVSMEYRGTSADIEDVWFALVEGDAPNNDYVRGKVVSISDVQVDPVNVSRSITFSDQKVEDVGTQSAGLKAHYTIDEKLLPDVANVLQHGSVARVLRAGQGNEQ